MARASREAPVLRAVLDYLAIRRIFAWRNNSGGTFLPGAGGRRQFVRFGAKGSSDVFAILPGGRFLAIECKRPGGKLTLAQEEWLESVRRSGGLAWVIDDVQRLRELLAEAGYPEGRGPVKAVSS